MGRLIKDLTGKRFGRLIANCQSGKTRQGNIIWNCVCDCGNNVKVCSGNLQNGNTESCGCYGREKTSEKKLKNLEGKKFGKLLVIYRVKNYKSPSGRLIVKWLCKCDCGNKISVLSDSLLSGHTQSCGCYKREKISEIKLKNLTGERFGKLTVINRVEDYMQPSGRIRTMWLCKCDCGNTTNATSDNLKSGRVKSCGCLSEPFIASEIKKYFIENYNAKTEYNILKNPKTKRWLPYDVYISRGKNLAINGIFIEVNGKQHYRLATYHYLQSKKKGTTPKQEFENQKYKDKLKKKFAKENGVYIEVDLRKTKTLEAAIMYIENILIDKKCEKEKG
jgi:hypothetical protein